MERIVNFDNMATLALLYLNEADENCRMISLKAVNCFAETVNENLNKMNSILKEFGFSSTISMYFYVNDINEETYLVIKPNINMKDKKEEYKQKLPEDIRIASLEANALNMLGLQMINGKLMKKTFYKMTLLSEGINPSKYEDAIRKYNNFNEELTKLGLEAEISMHDKATIDTHNILSRKK